MDTDYNLEQYKILTTMFDNEISRFWSRFNILFGIEIVGLIGIFNSLELLILNSFLFRSTLIFMIFFSSATCIIVIRGFMMHENILHILFKLEKKSKGKLQILNLSKSSSHIPIGFNQIIAIGITAIFILFWLSFLIFAEIKSYQFIISK
ncbi:MAG: hypothetical protein H8D45_03355 [Bacteroidetes bacterium]|nr:hypothetical protein [Bacteroidota bacterium]